MDLTLFIVFIILISVIYYLVMSIQSLILEIQEIKNKCIHNGSSKKNDFKVVTKDPAEQFGNKALQVLQNIKYILFKN